MDAVFLGRFAEGSLIRCEVRGAVFRPIVDEVSDPRLEGQWSGHMNSDEYFHPHSAHEPRLAVARLMLRIENDEGAWQGSGDEWHLPGVPAPGLGSWR